MPYYRYCRLWLILLIALFVLFVSSVGVSASQDAAGTVSGEPCAYFTYTPEPPTISDTVFFRVDIPNEPVCEVHYTEGYIDEYIWSFGGSGDTASRSFNEPGNYEVGLTAIDYKGRRTRYEGTVKVVNTPPEAEFSYSPDTPILNQKIEFDASSSSDLEGEIERYRWEMGDGTPAMGAKITHTYDRYGEYEVVLTINDGSKIDRITRTIEIENVPPVPEIEFRRLPEEVTTNDSIKVDASGSYDPDNMIEEYRWNFDDGTVRQGAIANHSYTKPGRYNITLITEDGIDTSRKTKQIIVTNRPPVVNISYTPEQDLTTEDRIIFNASSSYDPDRNMKGIQWNFGDGTSKTGEVVEHSYDELGTYEVTVEANDGIDTTKKSFTLTVAPSENSENLDGFGILAALLALFVIAFIIRS